MSAWGYPMLALGAAVAAAPVMLLLKADVSPRDRS